MTITTQHARSSYGIPVIIDDRGKLMDYAPGIRLALDKLGWTQKQFAEHTGKTLRMVEYWVGGKTSPPADALNVLRDALDKRQTSKA